MLKSSKEIEKIKRLDKIRFIAAIGLLGVVLSTAIIMLAFHFKVVKNSQSCFTDKMETIKGTDPEFYQYLEKHKLTNPRTSAFLKEEPNKSRTFDIIMRKDPNHDKSLDTFKKISDDMIECKNKTNASIRRWVIWKLNNLN